MGDPDFPLIYDARTVHNDREAVVNWQQARPDPNQSARPDPNQSQSVATSLATRCFEGVSAASELGIISVKSRCVFLPPPPESGGCGSTLSGIILSASPRETLEER